MAHVTATPNTVTPRKAKRNVKKTVQTSHPTTAAMVRMAIKNLHKYRGSSLYAIKKYISATYKVQVEKIAPFIKKYVKSSVASGSLIQTKGRGASGSFKLATQAVTKKSTSKIITRSRKPAAKPAPKKAAAKKVVAKKKAPGKKPKSPKPKPTKVTKSKKALPKKK